MDKVNSSNPQAMPLWERNKNSRGHRSAVEGALQAHRQRTSERQSRVQDRLNMVKGMQTQFFPKAEVNQTPSMGTQNLQSPVNTIPLEVSSEQFFNPRQIDDIYSEAELGSTADNALVVVGKEMANPEDGSVEDVPKGSYIDYNV